MLWFLFLHIASLVIWSAALVILLLLFLHPSEDQTRTLNQGDSLKRYWFTRLASPAAVLAIISGTGVFVVDANVNDWLLVKLTLVVGLVLCHVLAGFLILETDKNSAQAVTAKSLALLVMVLVLLLSILVLVLFKPELEAFIWFL